MNIQQQYWQQSDVNNTITYKINRSLDPIDDILARQLSINISVNHHHQPIQSTSKQQITQQQQQITIINNQSIIINFPKIYQINTTITSIQQHLQCTNIYNKLSYQILCCPVKLNYYFTYNWWVGSKLQQQQNMITNTKYLLMTQKGSQLTIVNQLQNYQSINNNMKEKQLYYGIYQRRYNNDSVQQQQWDKLGKCIKIITCYQCNNYMYDNGNNNNSRIQIQQQNIIYNYVISWESNIQLKSKLLMFQRQTKNNRNHPLLHYQIILSNQQIFFVYCRQLIVYNAIETYCYDQLKFKQQIMKISLEGRLRYPLSYYQQIFKYYQRLKLMQDTLDFKFGIKLIKYCMIQSIQVGNIEKKCIGIKNNQYSQKLECSLSQIQEENLQQDPINPTVIFYWLLGMPGCDKTQIYSQLQAKLQVFGVRVFKLSSQDCQISLNQKKFHNFRLLDFLQRPDLFKFQRFAYVLIDFSFSQGLLQQILEVIETKLSLKIHYQMYLITPLLQKAHEFHTQDISSVTSYCFSIQFIISAILNIQRRSNHPQFNGNSIDSLATILHYVSSVYSNLNLNKIVKQSYGNVKLMEYDDGRKIFWQDFDINFKQQIEDSLKILLETNYKSVACQDPLLWYFLQIIENIEVQKQQIQNIADLIISKTFDILPYIDILHSI